MIPKDYSKNEAKRKNDYKEYFDRDQSDIFTRVEDKEYCIMEGFNEKNHNHYENDTGPLKWVDLCKEKLKKYRK